MFLNFIKDFGLKKIIKISLSNYKPIASHDKITTVGVLIDESYFINKRALIEVLVKNGINLNAIETLSFFDRIKKGDTPDCCHYTRKDISASGTFEKAKVADFINKKFDMLISYYDVEKAPLVLATINSRATFKVGFGTIDKRLNNFTIASQAEKYTEFVAELFKYLKILNKI
jgi:hypothetical protein